jgi:hypothetical protein
MRGPPAGLFLFGQSFGKWVKIPAGISIIDDKNIRPLYADAAGP